MLKGKDCHDLKEKKKKNTRFITVLETLKKYKLWKNYAKITEPQPTINCGKL